MNILDYAMRLGFGAYDIKVDYDSVCDYGNTSVEDSVGKITITTDNDFVLRASDIPLRDGLNEARSRFWIRSRLWLVDGGSTDEVRIRVRYYGNGRLAIRGIQVEEKREYKVLTCIIVMCAMAVGNVIYIYFIKRDDTPGRQDKRIVIAGIAGITFLSSMPYFADFVKSGHDIWFHMSRILSLANALKEFQIPHRMQFEMLNGYGYAAPLYYGELFLLLPAVLHNLYLPVRVCYQIFVIAVNLATAIISCWCFMRMSGDWKKGLIGAFIYTFAAYRLTDVIARAAVGEYVALVFLPLLIYGLWSIYGRNAGEKISIKDCAPVIIATTGIINSHTLSCEMVLLFVILFVLTNYRKTFTKNIFAALVKSALFSLLLNLWFIIPFIQSMGMKVNINNEVITRIESNAVYLSQLFGIFHTAGGGNVWAGAKGEMPLSVGMTMTIGICIFIFVYIKKEEWHLEHAGKMRAATECFALGLLALFFSSSLCRLDNLIYISRKVARFAGMVQFPWRYLGIATAVLAAMVVFLLQILEEHISAASYNCIVFVLIAASVITEGHFIMEYVNVQDEIRAYWESDVGTMEVMGGEYLLQGTDRDAYKNRDIACSEGIEAERFYYGGRGKYYLECDNKTEKENFIDVPVQAYDNYHAYADNGEELPLETGENNKIRLAVPGNYAGTIRIEYVVPVLWRFCEIVSLAAMCAFMAILAKNKVKRFWAAK